MPSKAASSAFTGSRSTTGHGRAERPERPGDAAAAARRSRPRRTLVAATSEFVARMNPSTTVGPTPYVFSISRFSGESSITTTGNGTPAGELALQPVRAGCRLLGGGRDAQTALDRAGDQVGAVVEQQVGLATRGRARRAPVRRRRRRRSARQTTTPSSAAARRQFRRRSSRGCRVSTSSQPPASSTSTSTAVFGSTCRHMPIRRPASGRAASNSRARARRAAGMFARVQAIRSRSVSCKRRVFDEARHRRAVDTYRPGSIPTKRRGPLARPSMRLPAGIS